MHSAQSIHITRFTGSASCVTTDMVTAEEPLEIRLVYQTATGTVRKSISVTMRTPGNDAELAIGFLFTEGIIQNHCEVASVEQIDKKNQNVISVTLTSDANPDVSKLKRNFYTTSSCGVCGKSSIESVRTVCNIIDTKDNFQIPHTLFYTLPEILRKQQEIFENTGGIHACALFSIYGNLMLTREDVGRHNALDKLIGASLIRDKIPLQNHILMLSGRASFELVQKAAMAGIKVIAAVGAPSGLAVQMAEEWGITLIGFLRGERFNIYSGAQRII